MPPIIFIRIQPLSGIHHGCQVTVVVSKPGTRFVSADEAACSTIPYRWVTTLTMKTTLLN